MKLRTSHLKRKVPAKPVITKWLDGLKDIMKLLCKDVVPDQEWEEVIASTQEGCDDEGVHLQIEPVESVEKVYDDTQENACKEVEVEGDDVEVEDVAAEVTRILEIGKHVIIFD